MVVFHAIKILLMVPNRAKRLTLSYVFFSEKSYFSIFQKHLAFLLGSFGFATWWKEVFHWCLCYLYYVCCTSRQNADCMKLSENDNILTRFFPNK